MGIATNNLAEYTALIFGTRHLLQLELTEEVIMIRTDSQMIV